MGEAIDQDDFSPADYREFAERLATQSQQLTGLVQQPGFGQQPASVGVEVEMSLVDADARPALRNLELVEAAASVGAAAEVDQFGAEYDTDPVPLAGSPFAALAADLRRGLLEMERQAGDLGMRLVFAGTLPTLTEEVLLRDDIMTPEARYRAMAAALARHKFDDYIRFAGPSDEVSVQIPGIAAEGANNALQVHLVVAPDNFARVLNASHLVCAPVLAAAANSPFFVGRRLWADSRIPIFTQAVGGASVPVAKRRVLLASDWNVDGAAEVFAENAHRFEPILPVLYDWNPADEPPQLHETRLHAGTIWRWNRPVYDPTGDGHVRIEFRALPTGPTLADMIGNSALMLGASLAYAEQDCSELLPFDDVRENLWRAAEFGLDAELQWPDPGNPAGRRRPVIDILAELLPLATDALRAAGVDDEDVATAMAPVSARLERQINGARWQVATAAALERDGSRTDALAGVVHRMADNGFDGPPLAEWSVPN